MPRWGACLQFGLQSDAGQGDCRNLSPRWCVCYSSASKVVLAKEVGATFRQGGAYVTVWHPKLSRRRELAKRPEWSRRRGLVKPFAKVGRMLQFCLQSGACEGDWQNLLPRWGICYTSASKVELAKGIGETFLVALFVTFIFTCLSSLILVMIPQGGLLLATCHVKILEKKNP